MISILTSDAHSFSHISEYDHILWSSEVKQSTNTNHETLSPSLIYSLRYNTMSYIHYSTRHNITDPDLAGLLDYLEREMGWDINFKEYRSSNAIWISFLDFDIHIYPLNVSKEMVANISAYGHILYLPKELFFRTYRALLPVIRDLYSK